MRSPQARPFGLVRFNPTPGLKIIHRSRPYLRDMMHCCFALFPFYVAFFCETVQRPEGRAGKGSSHQTAEAPHTAVPGEGLEQAGKRNLSVVEMKISICRTAAQENAPKTRTQRSPQAQCSLIRSETAK